MTGDAPGGGAQRAAVQKLFGGPEAFPRDIKQKATYLQWAGVQLFKYMFWFTVAVAFAMFLYLVLKTPDLPPRSPTSAPPDTSYIRVLLEQRAQVFSNFKDIGSTILLTLSLPL